MVDDELPDCQELIRLLVERDWVVVAERTGFYARLPTNPQAADYVPLLLAAIQSLDAEHSDLWSGDLQPKLSADVSDEVSFSSDATS
jgi:hypothetical protein